jgi:hypothetical protein
MVVLEATRDAYIRGAMVLRVMNNAGGFREYRILNDSKGKYRIFAWVEGKDAPEVIAESLTADEAWNFLKLIGE